MVLNSINMKRLSILLLLSFFMTGSLKADIPASPLMNYELSADTLKTESAEELVQRQLEAYNARDIDAFMATYTEDIVINNFPETLIYKGQEAMRKRYKTMFEETSDLFCEIKKRIVLANKVIDHEYVRKNGNYISVVAIYEITNGLISKVTFVR